MPASERRCNPTGKPLSTPPCARCCPRAAACLRLAALLLTAAALAPSAAAEAADPFGLLATGKQRDESIAAIPFDQLEPGRRARIAAVVRQPTLFRRLPAQSIECDPQMFRFLVDNPEVIVAIWRVMDITDVSLDRVNDEQFHADDGAGTKGTLELCHRGAGVHVIYAEGSYEGALFVKPVRGRTVLVLRHRARVNSDGAPLLDCQLDAFVQLDHVGVEVLAKTFQPLVGHVADHNFRETAQFVESVNAAAESNFEGVQRMAARLATVRPDIRQAFARTAEEVAVRHALGYRAALDQSQPTAAAQQRSPGLVRRPAFRRQ